MPNPLALVLSAALASAAALSSAADTVLAQVAQPSLPGAPEATPGLPGGPRLPGGSGNYAVSAAANEHAAFLWVVDNIQHAVCCAKRLRVARTSPA